jgi:hypothetical protein
MQEILNWTINTIRHESIVDSTWLEEQKFEWTPLVVKSLKSLLDDNCTVLIITDNDRDWFGKYILSNINDFKNGRPNLPFYDFKSLLSKHSRINSQEDIQLIIDMLNISFPNGYIFWYIGKGESKESILPKYHSNSFLWLMDETLPGSLTFKENDDTLDIKLIQMYKLFNKTLNAILFAEISTD